MLKIDIDFLGKYNIIPSVFAVLRGIYVCLHTVQHIFFCFQFISHLRACLKNHSSNLHAPICGIFCLHSVDVAHYAALIQAKSPTNCNAHLAESIFQTRSSCNKALCDFFHKK